MNYEVDLALISETMKHPTDSYHISKDRQLQYVHNDSITKFIKFIIRRGKKGWHPEKQPLGLIYLMNHLNKLSISGTN